MVKVKVFRYVGQMSLGQKIWVSMERPPHKECTDDI